MSFCRVPGAKGLSSKECVLTLDRLLFVYLCHQGGPQSLYIKLQKSVHIEWGFPIKVWGLSRGHCAEPCYRTVGRLLVAAYVLCVDVLEVRVHVSRGRGTVALLVHTYSCRAPYALPLTG